MFKLISNKYLFIIRALKYKAKFNFLFVLILLFIFLLFLEKNIFNTKSNLNPSSILPQNNNEFKSENDSKTSNLSESQISLETINNIPLQQNNLSSLNTVSTNKTIPPTNNLSNKIKSDVITAEENLILNNNDEINFKNESTINTTLISNQKNQTQQKNTFGDTFLVTKVIDGDTFEIEGGIRVRMIGIDTPESVSNSTPVECYGQQAYLETKKLIEGKKVLLQKDVSETDRYKRLLRYVYLNDIFINDFLVMQGFATVSTFPPDVKYVDTFTNSQEYAKNYSLGLWGDYCQNFDIKSKENVDLTKNINNLNFNLNNNFICDCKKGCSKISDCNEAMYQLKVCGCSQRDGDKDGIPCESLCK